MEQLGIILAKLVAFCEMSMNNVFPIFHPCRTSLCDTAVYFDGVWRGLRSSRKSVYYKCKRVFLILRALRSLDGVTARCWLHSAVSLKVFGGALGTAGMGPAFPLSWLGQARRFAGSVGALRALTSSDQMLTHTLLSSWSFMFLEALTHLFCIPKISRILMCGEDNSTCDNGIADFRCVKP